MTLLLTHPAAEDLGRFVEGTLPESERREVVAHIADCDECRILVVDSAEFIEPAKKESPRWWGAVAAAVMVIAVGGGWFWNVSRDPKASMASATAKVSNRPVEPRLSGFDYVPRVSKRGGDDGETDVPVLQLQEKAADVLERHGDSPKIVQAKGVAHLLLAATSDGNDNIDIQSERREAIAALEAAANREPRNAGFQNDVAVALLSTGDPKQRDLAIVYLDKALAIDSRNPEALFNRALALRDRNPKEATAAFNRYLIVDSTSQWADEARRNLELLRPIP